MRHAAEEQFGVAVHEGLSGFDEMVEGQSLSWQQAKSISGMVRARAARPEGLVHRSGMMVFGKLWLDRAVSETRGWP
jgi:hypothetical protein